MASETAIPALAATAATLCLREHKGAPAELRAMAEGFRNAPLAWFPSLRPLMRLFDRPGAMGFAIRHLHGRAAMGVQTPEFEDAQDAPRFLAASRRALLLRHSDFAARRADALRVDARIIADEGIVASQWRYFGAALLGDLADAGHGRAEASRGASAELLRLSELSACLHASFAETSPAARLAWAEAFSEFDARRTLRALGVLPGWGALPASLRREQQGLADALYGQVDAGVAAAVAAIDDLVRVALLLAADSPVDKLLAARVARPTPARRGGFIDLRAEASAVRIGMAFAIHGNAGLLARGVVEDFANGFARGRIAEVALEGASIEAEALVHLSEAVAFRELAAAVRDEPRLTPALLPVGSGLLAAVVRA